MSSVKDMHFSSLSPKFLKDLNHMPSKLKKRVTSARRTVNHVVEWFSADLQRA